MDDFLDGCSDGCLGFFGRDPSNKSYSAGRATGSVLSDAAEDVAESGRKKRSRTGDRPSSKPRRVKLRLTVRKASDYLVDDIVDYGRDRLQIIKINRWVNFGRLWWKTCWIVAFCTPDQESALRRQVSTLKHAHAGAFKS